MLSNLLAEHVTKMLTLLFAGSPGSDEATKSGRAEDETEHDF
jgi:hypothetical protein